MEKLSGILPSSPRVRSVDLDEAPPVRPGAPNFGKKAGRNTVADRVTLSQQAKAINTTKAINPKEEAQKKIVDDLAKNFFETRLQKPAVAPPVPEEVPAAITPDEFEVDPAYSQAIKAYEKPVLSEQAALISTEA